MSLDWETQLFTFSYLKRNAEVAGPYTHIVPWLKDIMVIALGVGYVKPRQVLLELDPHGIPADYLAAVAYEWDSWGPSHPKDFIAMFECELRGSSSRTAVSAVIATLGRVTEGEGATAPAA